jgi:hypothetical protein
MGPPTTGENDQSTDSDSSIQPYDLDSIKTVKSLRNKN